MKKNKKEKAQVVELQDIDLHIPDSEVWTYQVEGLSAPRIGKAYSHYTLKKVLFVIVVVVAISLSIFFSIKTVQQDTLSYEPVSDGTYELVKFSNNGSITKMEVDYVSTLENVTEFKKDTSKPISTIHEYAFNCDEKLETIYIGETVTDIDGKAFYTCNSLKQIIVDENNPNYCDIDGVLYTKDMKEIICYPINHDLYLANNAGYEKELELDDDGFDEYAEKVLTYKIPETVETVNQLCFNYSTLVDVYLPQGLKTIETLAFFRCTQLQNVYSYDGDKIYNSLPEGLEYIGSDAFSYNQAMTYVYIPESVNYIGHHAFWDTVYKEDGELKGVTYIDVGMSEDEFENNVHCGDQWKPKYDHLLFKKNVDVNFGAERK